MLSPQMQSTALITGLALFAGAELAARAKPTRKWANTMRLVGATGVVIGLAPIVYQQIRGAMGQAASGNGVSNQGGFSAFPPSGGGGGAVIDVPAIRIPIPDFGNIIGSDDGGITGGQL